MKKNILSIISVLFIFASALSSCSNDNDSIAPEINIISPLNEDEFQLGDTLRLKIHFSDNEALASYKINIHYNDGHTHTKQSIDDVRFAYDKEFNDIAGKKSAEIELKIFIPKTDKLTEKPILQGGYHLGVYCLDQSKNENVQFIEIDLIN